MKKIISLFLSFILLISLVLTVSCSSQDEEVFDLEYNTDYEVDLTGHTFTWGSAWNTQLLPSLGFSTTGDMIHKRISDLKEKYGCDFNIVYWGEETGRILTELAAGYNTIDILDGRTSHCGYALYKANLLYALEDIPNIDLSGDKYGNQRLLQYGIFDGKKYGFFHYYWDFCPEFHGLIHFNSAMLSSFGISLPHELRENGLWTWENYKEYLISIQVAAESAGYDSEFVPHICGDSYARDAIGFMFANGLTMIEGSNGNYTFGFDNSNGLATIEFMADLYAEGLYEQRGPVEFAKDRKAALMSHESYYSTNFDESTSVYLLSKEDFAYGMIRFPYGPNGNENSVSSYAHHVKRLNWVLNKSANDAEEIGIVMDYVFNPLDESEGWSSYLENQILYTKEDHQEYLDTLENLNFDYGNLFLGKGYDNWTSDINNAVRGNKSISEVFSSSRSAIQEAIDQNVTWTYDELVSK